MDFRHLRAFIAVAETLSVTRAAARLHISQPPLSRHIHQLEEELGVTLFVRHRQGVTLTDAGRRLLEKARSLDAVAREFYEAAREAASGQSNTIRIGIGWGLWDVVNSIRVEFAKQYPNVAIEASDAFCSEKCEQRLKDFSLDVAFGRPPLDTSTLEVTPVYHERIQAVIGADSPLASKSSVSLRELSELPLLLWDRHIAPVLYDKVLDLYARQNLAPTMIPTPGAGPYNHAGLMHVASGKGTYVCLGIALTQQPASGVAVLPVADHDATIEVCVANRKGETSTVVNRFLNCVWQVFPQERPEPVPVMTGALYDARYAASALNSVK
jgi:DNA-binding transcriptional LysR family regulator